MKDCTRILAENIAFLRKKHGYTQEFLADKLGVTFQAVSKWENKQSSPDIALLPQLAKIFGIHIDELFGLIVEKPNCYETIDNLPWPDDNALRAAVFRGHTLLDETTDTKRFTFAYEGVALKVISYGDIECECIQNGAEAGGSIICRGSIYGNVTAGNDVNVGGTINGDTAAGNAIVNK